MNESSSQPHRTLAALPVRTLVMAVLAPFGAIALLASPLLVDAVSHAFGS